jgi:hypothetical protein
MPPAAATKKTPSASAAAKKKPTATKKKKSTATAATKKNTPRQRGGGGGCDAGVDLAVNQPTPTVAFGIPSGASLTIPCPYSAPSLHGSASGLGGDMNPTVQFPPGGMPDVPHHMPILMGGGRRRPPAAGAAKKKKKKSTPKN